MPSSAICPAISTPVGPAPTTTNVSHAARAASSVLDLRRLEREQDALAQVERALERLQLRRVRRPVVVAEVRVARARRDDEQASYGSDTARAVRQVVDDDVARLEVEPGHLAEDHARVALPAHDLAQRHRDLDRRERARRDLVGERLEEIEVLPVDERHLDVGAAEPSHREQPAEPTTDDNDLLAI